MYYALCIVHHIKIKCIKKQHAHAGVAFCRCACISRPRLFTKSLSHLLSLKDGIFTNLTILTVAISWPNLRSISNISQLYLNHILALSLSQPYLRYIQDISQIYLSHIWTISQPYLSHNSAISQPYLGNISAVSKLYLCHISTISPPYLTYISTISKPYLSNISAISQQVYNFASI